MKRVTKSRQFLEEVCRVKEIDGQFYVDKPRAGLTPLYRWTQASHHKYGKTCVYEYTLVYNYEKHKQVIMSFQSFVYAWYKGEVPAGYDVDHIDDDSLNNSIDNLQLLTHEENIKKRGGGKNQYTAAKENGLPKPIYDRTGKGKGRKLEKHSDEFLEKQAIRQALKRELAEAQKAEKAEVKVAKRLQELEKQLARVKVMPYRYEGARQSTINKLEIEINNLKSEN